jgi:cytochrome c5
MRVSPARAGQIRQGVASVSGDQDRKFFDVFMLVLGILVGVAIGVYALAHLIADRTQAEFVRSDAAYQERIDDRIRPVGRLAIKGEDNSDVPMGGPSLAGAAAPAAAATAAPAAEMTGDQVYNTACAACHGAGVAGAPKLGDAAAWAPRIAQGIDTLSTHAINGFQGSAGYKPPKGGRPDLTDDAVRAAVQHMVDASQ